MFESLFGIAASLFSCAVNMENYSFDFESLWQRHEGVKLIL